jgi:pimeloyl-ACP methyl ester carboxylesterase
LGAVDELIREGRRRVRGRWIAFAEWGDPDGAPVLAWPGGLGSRFGWGWARAEAASSGVRLVIPDRPGYGRSDACTDRSVASTATDVHEMLGRLGIRRYRVLGNSSGAPYALAMAARHAAAVERVGVVAGVAPFAGPGWPTGMSPENRKFWTTARRGPAALTPHLTSVVANAVEDDDLHPERRADITEAARQGPQELAYDAWLVATPWDVDLRSVEAHVDVWHGAEDDDVPLPLAEQLARVLPRSTLHIWPNRGHEMNGADMADVYTLLLGATVPPI